MTKPTSQEHHFGTQHLLANLSHRAVSSTILSVGAQTTRFAVSMLSVIVLNKLLLPRDFGVVAVVTSAMGILSVFKDAGLSIPTVQRAGITHAQVSNLFWINVALSGVASLCFAALAYPLVWFFREPEVGEITSALAWMFLVTGLAAQPRAILSRQMRFNAVATIDVAMVLVGSGVGIAMALAGFRHWSLVGQIAGTEVTGLVLTWSACRWRPGLPTDLGETKPLLRFGATLGASSLMLSIARLSDVVMIGRLFGPEATGLYSRASALLIRPMDQILPALNAVFVPALSRLQHDPVRFRLAFLRTFGAVALLTYPPTALMFGLARPLTLVLFGPAWGGVTPIFASLAIAGVFLGPTNVTTWLFYSTGRGRDWLKTSAMLSILMVVFFAIGLSYGPTGVALAFSLSGTFVLQPLLFHRAGRRGPVSTADLVKGVLRFLPLWIVVSATSYLASRTAGDLSYSWHLVFGVPAGLFGGALTVLLVPSMRDAALELVRNLRNLRGRSIQDTTAPATLDKEAI